MLPALMIVVKSNPSPFWKSNTVDPKAPRWRGSALHRFALACVPSDPGAEILDCWPFIRRGSGSPERRYDRRRSGGGLFPSVHRVTELATLHGDDREVTVFSCHRPQTALADSGPWQPERWPRAYSSSLRDIDVKTLPCEYPTHVPN
jgi:hypothetical protein